MIQVIATRVTAQARQAGAAIPVTVETFFGDGVKEIAACATTRLKRPATAPGQLQGGLATLRVLSKQPVAGRPAPQLTSGTDILVLPHETPRSTPS